MTEGRPTRPAAFWLTGGALLYAAFATLFFTLTGLAALDVLYLGALLVLLPVLATAQLDALDGVSIERVPAYGGSVIALMILTGLTVTVGARQGGLEGLGLVHLPPGVTIAWTALLLAAGLATIYAFRWLALALGVSEAPLLRELIPRTGREKAIFAMLSVWAGVGEELTYRGYAILALAPVTGPFGAALASSAVFGMLHAYQGPLGIVRSGVTGGLLAWGFLASGSLWPPILAHALVDVVAGLLLADRLMVPERPAGVDGLDDAAGTTGTHGT